VIGTLAVDGWAVTFGTARRGLGSPPRPLLTVPNVTAHPSTASVPTSYYLMWHYNCLWSLNRVPTCLENLEMPGNLTGVREMSGILLKVREMSEKKSCQGKVA